MENAGASELAGVKREIFGTMPDGREAGILTPTNGNGLKARAAEYGAILTHMEVQDKSGKTADFTHGYDTLAGWLTNTSYFGATAGRFGNRIKDGEFTLDGKSYTLAMYNDPGRHRLPSSNGIHLAARLKDPKSGRVMEISTNSRPTSFMEENTSMGASRERRREIQIQAPCPALKPRTFLTHPTSRHSRPAFCASAETYRHVMIHKFSAG